MALRVLLIDDDENDIVLAKRALAALAEGSAAKVGVLRKSADGSYRFETLVGTVTGGQVVLSGVAAPEK